MNVARFMLGFHRIFVLIRSDIRNSCNMDLLRLISKYSLSLREEHISDFETFKLKCMQRVKHCPEIKNQLQNALAIYEFNHTDNLMEINRYLLVISDAALEIRTRLKHEEFARAYDLVDAIHCLSEAIISKNSWEPKQFWTVYMKPYREKWDNHFLVNVEREVLNTRGL